MAMLKRLFNNRMQSVLLAQRALLLQLGCIVLMIATIALLPEPDRHRERVVSLDGVSSIPEAPGPPPDCVVEEASEVKVESDPSQGEIEAIVRALGIFGVRQQMLDWAREWEIARKLQGGLVMRQLDLAQRTAAATGELGKIKDLERTCEEERMSWRKVEADIVHRSMRLKLSDLETAREELAQKFAEGSVWMRRGEAIIAALARRLKETPEEMEVERVMIADPTREWLRARKSQVEVQLEGLEAQAEVVATQLQAVSVKLREYRRLAGHLLSLLKLPAPVMPDPENLEIAPLQ
jgi:cell division septation protein DedD